MIDKKQSILPFFLIALCFVFSSCENLSSPKSNIGNSEDLGELKTVSVCRYCGLVVEFEGERLFPDNRTIKQKCSQWEGHMWYNAGTSGHNPFKCARCGVRVSIKEKKPLCMSFCDEACNGESQHKWVKMD
jgi:hypothetical protein